MSKAEKYKKKILTQPRQISLSDTVHYGLIHSIKYFIELQKKKAQVLLNFDRNCLGRVKNCQKIQGRLFVFNICKKKNVVPTDKKND